MDEDTKEAIQNLGNMAEGVMGIIKGFGIAVILLSIFLLCLLGYSLYQNYQQAEYCKVHVCNLPVAAQVYSDDDAFVVCYMEGDETMVINGEYVKGNPYGMQFENYADALAFQQVAGKKIWCGV